MVLFFGFREMMNILNVPRVLLGKFARSFFDSDIDVYQGQQHHEMARMSAVSDRIAWNQQAESFRRDFWVITGIFFRFDEDEEFDPSETGMIPMLGVKDNQDDGDDNDNNDGTDMIMIMIVIIMSMTLARHI